MKYLTFIITCSLTCYIVSCKSQPRQYKASSGDCYIKSIKSSLAGDSVSIDFHQDCRKKLNAKLYRMDDYRAYYYIDTNKIYISFGDSSGYIPVIDSLGEHFKDKLLHKRINWKGDDPMAILWFIINKEGEILIRGGNVNFVPFSDEDMIAILDKIHLEFEPLKIENIPVCYETTIFVYLEDHLRGKQSKKIKS